ncbi:MAG: thymidine phosphorylase [Candidatus Thermoplasmatota archaeon]|nr:thymidine phosphorylase [Candidatus Thermoplasmatota archaeon]
MSIDEIIDGVVDGTIPDEEVVSWLKKVFNDGLPTDETVFLTESMRDSGEVLSWQFPGPYVDKHSTGGVGDKVSIPLAPALAACGLKVPMISGRGLGHTGGTLDKLESIPGLRVSLEAGEIVEQVNNIGLAMVGQTEGLVPADRRLYALRDVTGTIASLPLITSSIVSKKAAEGISSLVLDVKFGRAAFMESRDSAEELARSMVSVSKGMGISASAILSTMDQPIGYSVGNSLEIIESVETMCGRGPVDLEELVCVLGGMLLRSSGMSEDIEEGASKIQDSLYDGTAFNKFLEMVGSQGGDTGIFESEYSLMRGLGILDGDLFSTTIEVGMEGWVSDIDAMTVAEACLEMGAGRKSLGDEIDRRVGVALEVQVGDYLEKGEVWATIYHNEEGIEEIARMLGGAIQLSDSEPVVQSRISEVIW